ncbi:hypothetical protein TPHA_0O00550 [Tetrapisispora phaffii CBS 4417]|uniref:Altered inheritance of mitochondria protein 32 n=1 Tax=Tetrapisispora phaffii (strain ATCC 24235 / CBS 4417 / NBRC 1672 / NRRL Y-8282 / UCD 70-5) TaxID=1071381 RepID=G8C1J7_TETPH|nr:hypothetical protein TPHA_0O00550 [Tetrapisispora phaffii CBS 4417]CCE66025.1 hypothetical protein TPHA_0O00550 [Tetrapisispora phaffii CBS 4417]
MQIKYKTIESFNNLKVFNKINLKLPLDKQIDTVGKLPPIPNYEKHLMIIDKNDDSNNWMQGWGSRLEMNDSWPYNLVGLFKNEINKYKKNGVMTSVVKLKQSTDVFTEIRGNPTNDSALIYVIPDMKLYTIRNDESTAVEFIKYVIKDLKVSEQLHFQDYLKKGGLKTPTVTKADSIVGVTKRFEGRKLTNDWILVCGHNERDCRCGYLAPLLVDEYMKFDKRSNIGIISHVSGHKFAGNVIHYKYEPSKNSMDSFWFGRVLPPMVHSLVENLKNNIVIKNVFRGSKELREPPCQKQ